MNNLNKTDESYSIKFILWIIFYCYATFAALIFQKLLLPMFPGFHGGERTNRWRRFCFFPPGCGILGRFDPHIRME